MLWGYWCQNPKTGAVCAGQIDTTQSSGIIKTTAESIQTIIDSGINLLTLFSNIWQPAMQYNQAGSFKGGEGQSAGKWSTTYGTEGEIPLGGEECGNKYIKQLQSCGVSVLLTIGSWDAIFPRDNNQGYTTMERGNGTTIDTCSPMKVADAENALPCMPGRWSDEQVTQFVETLSDMSDRMGGIDGFDFDLEGFGAGTNPHKEGVWTAWCNTYRDGGPYPNATYPGDGKAACYSLPDAGTLDTFNRVFKQLKEKGFIVTVVPMSTGLYTNDSADTTPQNQFVVHGLDHTNVDGIMLQWYSGSGLNICNKAPDGLCENDATNQCDNPDGDTNASRMTNLRNVLNNKISPTLKNKSYWPGGPGAGLEGDSINYFYNTNPVEFAEISATGKCPYKCPRKIDCPDWAYTEDTHPFETQVNMLSRLKDWLGEEEFSKKLVIGLEGFPNFSGNVKMGAGTFPVWTQFWGPVPSAQAVVGLDDAIKGNQGMSRVAAGGIAGVGIYTANTAFKSTYTSPPQNGISTGMQYGGDRSIYHKLKLWKDTAT